MKTIQLTRGYETVVDDEDYEYLSQWNWHFDGNYAARTQWNKETKKETKIYMHRVLISAKKVDHIDRNKLNNTRANLRGVNSSQNNMNQTVQARKKHSRYKGVSYDITRNKWMAYCKKNGKQHYLGRFDDEIHAALAYNEKAKALFGEYAKLNEVD